MAKEKEKKDAGSLLVTRNAKATMRYAIEDRLETGIVLKGSEVKSMRMRRCDLDGAYAQIENGELFLHKMHIAPYEQANAFGHEPKGSRKLLAHKSEIEKLDSKLRMRGYTLVPLSVYFKNGRCKVEIGLAKGKDMGDKREDLKKKAVDRETRAALSGKRNR